MSLPCLCLCIFHFIHPQALPHNFSEFICSPPCACQSNLSSGFAFIKCIPHPLAFYSISPTRQILSVKATNDSSARSASLIIYLTYIYLFLQQVPESRGFSSVPCHLKTLPLSATSQWHRQHHFAAIRRETCQQRMGFKLFLTKKTTLKQLADSLFTDPKGYLETPGQTWIVCRRVMDGLAWQTTRDKEMCSCRL